MAPKRVPAAGIFSIWWDAIRLAVVCVTRFDRVCLITGYTSGLTGPSTQAWTLLGGVRFIAWQPEAPQKGKCRRHFWDCQTRLGNGPATGPTLKTTLCQNHTLVVHMTNTARDPARALAHAQKVLSPTLRLKLFLLRKTLLSVTPIIQPKAQHLLLFLELKSVSSVGAIGIFVRTAQHGMQRVENVA